jgi:hypothetical protein
MSRYYLIGFSLLFIAFYSCKESTKPRNDVFGTKNLKEANTKLLEIAMEDGFPPPIASRVYVYPHLAHYLTLSAFYPDSLKDISSEINGFSKFSIDTKTEASPELTSLLSFCNVAKKVVFSEHLMDDFKSELLIIAKNGDLSEQSINASLVLADTIAARLIKWISMDNYVQTRTMDRWTSSKEPGKWRETPPDYQAGLEPNWSKMRTLIIDSANFYITKPLPAYSPDKNSDFFKMVNEVYQGSSQLDSSKIATAWYWDDNPNTSEHSGHLVTIIHKISPPGHWLSIISGIITSENSSLFTATKAYTYSAIAMYDGIISCWYEKYKTNLVRPVSYIQEYIDTEWKPLIQTPPFPEYTSGHSVISASAATVLNDIYGNNFSFVDSSQMMFGIAPRKFENFDAAAWEVSLSRFYGGIHYMNGVEEGNKQGKFIGQHVISKLK